jgi:mannitol/fructose-specific phosphotransferase system IIA component (Ntr-type)
VTTHTLLDPSLYVPELAVRTREQALEEMVRLLHEHGTVRDATAVVRLLLNREALGSTSIGKGVAVPHARSLAVTSAHLVLARSKRGVDWGAADGEPAHLIFLLLAPDTIPWHKRYLDLLAGLVQVVRLARNRHKLLEAKSFDTVAAVFRDLA